VRLRYNDDQGLPLDAGVFSAKEECTVRQVLKMAARSPPRHKK